MNLIKLDWQAPGLFRTPLKKQDKKEAYNNLYAILFFFTSFLWIRFSHEEMHLRRQWHDMHISLMDTLPYSPSTPIFYFFYQFI